MPSVLVQCHVHNSAPDQPLRYRVWVNRELFAERHWRWSDDCYLEENIGINAIAGRCKIRITAIEGNLSVSNWTVAEGRAEIDQQGNLRIDHENT